MFGRMSQRPVSPLGERPYPSAAPWWRFVDRFGTEWRVYDRVRWAPTPTRAEFRFVPPGHRDARSRLFVRADRVVFEVRLCGRPTGAWCPTDVTDRTLNVQLRAARQAGPVYIPPGAETTPALELRRFAREFAGGAEPARAPHERPADTAPPEREARRATASARAGGASRGLGSPCTVRGAGEAWSDP